MKNKKIIVEKACWDRTHHKSPLIDNLISRLIFYRFYLLYITTQNFAKFECSKKELYSRLPRNVQSSQHKKQLNKGDKNENT